MDGVSLRRDEAGAPAVAEIVLDRPDALNALDTAMARRLTAVCADLAADSTVRAIVVSASGPRAFCAGADLKGMFRDAPILEAREQYAGLARILEGIPRMRTPVIGQVHGYALAGGCRLAAACDVVVASEDAVFGLPEIKLGLLPLMVMAPILRAASPKRVLQLVLTGAELPAREAAAIGLVSQVVPRADLDATAQALARTIAGYSPAAVAIAKEAFYATLELDHARALPYLRDLLTIVARSEDAREGVAAFLAKRPPRWTGL